MSSLSPGLTSSRCPSGGRYRPSAARNWTRAGIASPVVASTISTSMRRMAAAAVRWRGDRTAAPAIGRKPARRHDLPIDVERGVGRHGHVDEGGDIGRLAPGAAPADDRRGQRPAGRDGRRSRAHPDDLSEVDRDRRIGASSPFVPRGAERCESTRSDRLARGGAEMPCPGTAVTAATTTPPPSRGGQRFHRQTGQGGGTTGDRRSRAARGRCRRRARDTVGHAGLRRAPCPGQDRRAVRPRRVRRGGRFLERGADLATRAARRAGADGRRTPPAPSRRCPR